MKLHDRFEWDEEKDQRNWRKHGISFDDAAFVLLDELGDEYHLEEYDEEHSGREQRWRTAASHPTQRSVILRIVWTERLDALGSITRIISARPANAAERRTYESRHQED